MSISTIHVNPFDEGSSKEDFKFRQFLKDAIPRSLQAFNASASEEILEIWGPELDNDYFKTGNPHWEGKPVFQSMIQNGRIHVAFAALSLGFKKNMDSEMLMLSYNSLIDLIAIAPFSMAGASAERLDTETARDQNQFYYEQLKQLYHHFYRDVLPWLSCKGSITSREDDELCNKIKQRLKELESCLDLPPGQS